MAWYDLGSVIDSLFTYIYLRPSFELISMRKKSKILLLRTSENNIHYFILRIHFDY